MNPFEQPINYNELNKRKSPQAPELKNEIFDQPLDTINLQRHKQNIITERLENTLKPQERHSSQRTLRESMDTIRDQLNSE